MSEFCGLLWQINRTWARGLLEPLIYTQLVRSTGVWSGRRGSLAELSPLPVGSNDRIRADPVRTELNWHLAAFSVSVSCLSSTPCEFEFGRPQKPLPSWPSPVSCRLLSFIPDPPCLDAQAPMGSWATPHASHVSLWCSSSIIFHPFSSRHGLLTRTTPVCL